MLLKTRTLQAKNAAVNQDDYSVAPARSGRSRDHFMRKSTASGILFGLEVGA